MPEFLRRLHKPSFFSLMPNSSGLYSRFSPRERSKVLVNPVRSFMLIAFSGRVYSWPQDFSGGSDGIPEALRDIVLFLEAEQWSPIQLELVTVSRTSLQHGRDFIHRRGQITVDNSRLPYVRQIGQSM